MKMKSESEVAQSCLTPRHPVDCSPPGSSIHGIFQARVLEWGAIAVSRNSKTMLNKSHRIMSIDAENTFDKIKYLFIIKKFSRK